MLILAIETSCDETSLALIEAHSDRIFPERAGRVEGLPTFKIKKLLTASQIETHRPWGGVVPNLAKREHQTNLPKLFKKLVGMRGSTSPIKRSNLPDIDLIAVTTGPGLEPCLWQGIEFAKKIQKTHFPKAKIIPTNHLHGHMYSFLLPQKNLQSAICLPAGKAGNLQFPAIQLLVSGGHTILILMESLTKYRKLGETRDDAAGEAFDKVARMLGLPYPGGPEIERLAKNQMSNVNGQMSIVFPRPMLHDKNYDFSFSGLKTAVLYYLRNLQLSCLAGRQATFNLQLKTTIAAAFQEAAIDVLTTKTLRAAKEYNAKSVILSGGVAANSALRKELKRQSAICNLQFLSAAKKYQGDNAAMIGVAGYITALRKKNPAPWRSFTGYPLKATGTLDV